jgi:hypothetical protein
MSSSFLCAMFIVILVVQNQKFKNQVFFMVFDAPANSLKNPNVNSKVKTMEEKVEVCSLTRSVLGVRGAC